MKRNNTVPVINYSSEQKYSYNSYTSPSRKYTKIASLNQVYKFIAQKVGYRDSGIFNGYRNW